MNLITSHSPLKEFLEEFRRFLIEHDISCEQGRLLGMGPKPRSQTTAAWISLRKRWNEIDFLLSAVPVAAKSQPEKAIKANWLHDYINAVDLYLNTPYASPHHGQVLKLLCDEHEAIVAGVLISKLDNCTEKGGRK